MSLRAGPALCGLREGTQEYVMQVTRAWSVRSSQLPGRSGLAPPVGSRAPCGRLAQHGARL